MSLDIFTHIRSNFNVFTKAEKKVATFILENPEKVLYMSITDLAEACKVGDTSVFRFCKTLKLKGYQEFKVALAQRIPTEEESTPQLSEKLQETDTINDIKKKVLMTNVAALEETYKLIQTEDIMQAVDWLVDAERIVFYGVGASLMTAMEAMNKFVRITPKVECVSDPHIQSMRAALMTEKDVAIMVSYSGSTKDMIDIGQIAKNSGAKTICITRFMKSPLTAFSDLILLCGANEGPLQGGSLSAKLSQLYLLDVVYTEYFKRTLQQSKKNKEITAQAVSTKLY